MTNIIVALVLLACIVFAWIYSGLIMRWIFGEEDEEG